MGWRARDDLSTADAGFEAEAGSLEILFQECWTALLDLLLENPESIALKSERRFVSSASTGEQLLFDFLNFGLFLKDSENSLFVPLDMRIAEGRLECVFHGEAIDPSRHRLGTDVKAVSYHGLSVWRDGWFWRATFVADI
jgi:SHS2 domain-containing protein